MTPGPGTAQPRGRLRRWYERPRPVCHMLVTLGGDDSCLTTGSQAEEQGVGGTDHVTGRGVAPPKAADRRLNRKDVTQLLDGRTSIGSSSARFPRPPRLS